MFSLIRWQLMFKLLGGSSAARRLGVKVGAHCRIYSGMFGSEPWLVSIGDRVTVTYGVTFLTHDGSTWLFRDNKGRRYKYARIEVGNDVFIGVHSILMPGVKIGDRCIVGAGSVVTKSIPSGSIVAGNPATFIKNFDEYEAIALQTFPDEEYGRKFSFRERVLDMVDAGFKKLLDPTVGPRDRVSGRK